MRKFEVLLKEANDDLERGNLNKAVSALYFAVRKRLECILLILRYEVPRRDDKLANVLKYLGYSEESKIFIELYELRKKADYSEEVISSEEAKKALEYSTRILKILEKLEERVK
jgi:HEPN domain.